MPRPDTPTIGTPAAAGASSTPTIEAKELLVNPILGFIGLLIWIGIAFWPARVAGRKGHSFILYFLLSLLFFPLSLILAYVAQDRTNVI